MTLTNDLRNDINFSKKWVKQWLKRWPIFLRDDFKRWRFCKKWLFIETTAASNSKKGIRSTKIELACKMIFDNVFLCLRDLSFGSPLLSKFSTRSIFITPKNSFQLYFWIVHLCKDEKESLQTKTSDRKNWNEEAQAPTAL